MEKFCKGLREHATKIINYEKKDMIPLTKMEQEQHSEEYVIQYIDMQKQIINT